MRKPGPKIKSQWNIIKMYPLCDRDKCVGQVTANNEEHAKERAFAVYGLERWQIKVTPELDPVRVGP